MTDVKRSDLGDPIPPTIGAPAMRALLRAEIRSYADLTTWAERDLAGLHGVGPHALKILHEGLAARDGTFAPPSSA